ncbi:MAG: hypothetical protein CUN48_19500, partial [Candidatus Thermofonsia Clade 3 bacterium]
MDALHADLLGRFDHTNKRIDETNKRMDALHADLLKRIDEVRARADQHFMETTRRIEVLAGNMQVRFDQLNARLDRFEERYVLRTEQQEIKRHIEQLEQRMQSLE